VIVNILRMLTHKFSSVIIVGLTALIVVMLGFFLSLRTPAVDPRVTLEDRQDSIPQRPTINNPPPRIASVWDGEVMRLADRIGEATGLALAASIYAASEQVKNRTPRSVGDLMSGVAQQGLLPPGLRFTKSPGGLLGPRGILIVRYRLAPLAVEVVSTGYKPEDGPALIVRVPDYLSEKGEANLYLANKQQGVEFPVPFAPAPQVIALGWIPERLRGLR
jgi:hypothetical protein